MTEVRKGHIHRIVESLGMGYIADPENDQLWSFLFSQLEGYRGEYPEEIGLAGSIPVEFTVSDGVLVSVKFGIPDKSLAASSKS